MKTIYFFSVIIILATGCPDGTYYDPTSNTCKSCNINCLTCTGPKAIYCLSCNSP